MPVQNYNLHIPFLLLLWYTVHGFHETLYFDDTITVHRWSVIRASGTHQKDLGSNVYLAVKLGDFGMSPSLKLKLLPELLCEWKDSVEKKFTTTTLTSLKEGSAKNLM